MEDRIKQDIKEIIDFNSTSSVEIEDFRIKYLGKKGLLNSYFVEFKSLDNDKKKNVGQLLNQLKNTSLKGRRQVDKKNPKIILDLAHKQQAKT